jgi:hypothetical protein
MQVSSAGIVSRRVKTKQANERGLAGSANTLRGNAEQRNPRATGLADSNRSVKSPRQLRVAPPWKCPLKPPAERVNWNRPREKKTPAEAGVF